MAFANHGSFLTWLLSPESISLGLRLGGCPTHRGQKQRAPSKCRCQRHMTMKATPTHEQLCLQLQLNATSLSDDRLVPRLSGNRQAAASKELVAKLSGPTGCLGSNPNGNQAWVPKSRFSCANSVHRAWFTSPNVQLAEIKPRPRGAPAMEKREGLSRGCGGPMGIERRHNSD
jgi:hypothetical protein